MKPNFSEYIQYYLTDFEWLIILACLWKPLGPKHFLSRYNLPKTFELLQNLRGLSFLDVQIFPLERRHYYRWKDVLRIQEDRKNAVGVNAYCKDVPLLEKWVKNYIEYYKNGKILGLGDFAMNYPMSLQSTRQLLKQYKQYNNGLNAIIQRETDFGNGKILKVRKNSRLFEDLYILATRNIINFTAVNYSYNITKTQKTENNTPASDILPQLILSLSVCFDVETSKKQRIEMAGQTPQRTEKEILPIQKKIRKKEEPINSLIDKDNTEDLYKRFKSERENPFDIKTTSIFYDGKKLNFKYNTQPYRLLELLINSAGVVSKKVAIDMLRMETYFGTESMGNAKDGAEVEQIKKGRKYNNLKLYCSIVRKKLPRSISLVLDENGVYLKKS